MKECGACGKSNKDWATVCLCGEPFSDDPSGPQQGQTGKGEAAAGPAASTSGDPLMAKRYSNLAKAAKGLASFGGFLKIAAVLVGVAGVGLGAVFADTHDGEQGFLVFVFGATTGVALFAMGVLFAATGEAALALGHIASAVAPEKQTEPVLDVEAATDPGQ